MCRVSSGSERALFTENWALKRHEKKKKNAAYLRKNHMCFFAFFQLCHPLLCLCWLGFNRWWWCCGSSLGVCELEGGRGGCYEGKMERMNNWFWEPFFFCLFVFCCFRWLPASLTWPLEYCRDLQQDFTVCVCVCVCVCESVCVQEKQLTVESSPWLACLSEEKRIRRTSYVSARVCVFVWFSELVFVCCVQHLSTPTRVPAVRVHV